MSNENVEVIRTLYDLGANPLSDPPDPGAYDEYLDEKFEIRLPADYPEGQPVFTGRDGLTKMAAMLADVWDKWRLEPHHFIDAGDRVGVFVRIIAEGEASGVPIERESTHVWTVRDGFATSMRAYLNRAEGLAAAGLRKQTQSAGR